MSHSLLASLTFGLALLQTSSAETETHLAEGRIRIDLPSDWSFSEGEGALASGSPPNDWTLGVARHAAANDWSVEVGYLGVGHLAAVDARELVPHELIKRVKAAAVKDNANGPGAFEVIGFSVTPHYDRRAKRLVWAERMHFQSEPSDTIDYQVRTLGRDGVLAMHTVAPAERLDEIQARLPELLAATSFTAGNRYDDFDGASDPVAPFGLDGLITDEPPARPSWLSLYGKLLLIGFAAALACKGLKRWLGGPASAAETEESRAMYHELRKMALDTLSVDLDLEGPIADDTVLVVLLEMDFPGAIVTLVTMADGTVSLYTSNGGGMIGFGQREETRAKGLAFVGAVQEALDAFEPMEESPLPGREETRFNIVTDGSGIRTACAPTEDLANDRHELSRLFHKGLEVIAELRTMEMS